MSGAIKTESSEFIRRDWAEGAAGAAAGSRLINSSQNIISAHLFHLGLGRAIFRWADPCSQLFHPEAMETHAEGVRDGRSRRELQEKERKKMLGEEGW